MRLHVVELRPLYVSPIDVIRSDMISLNSSISF